MKAYLSATVRVSVIAFICFVLPMAVLGQDVPGGEPVVEPEVAEPAEPAMDSDSKWEYLIAVIAPFIVAGIRWAIPRTPKLVLPAITPLIGIGLGFGLNALADAGMSGEAMAKAGGLAVIVREVTDQALKAAGLRKEDDEPETPTKESAPVVKNLTGTPRK